MTLLSPPPHACPARTPLCPAPTPLSPVPCQEQKESTHTSHKKKLGKTKQSFSCPAYLSLQLTKTPPERWAGALQGEVTQSSLGLYLSKCLCP